jgi:hypothetical protein
MNLKAGFEMMKSAHPLSRVIAGLMLLSLPLACSSCAALYFLGGGKGDQDPLYKIPQGKRVLVLVDTAPSVTATPGFTKLLGQKINDHLYKYKATDTLVAQARLDTLKSDPAFPKMGIADVARAAGADIVIYVNIVSLNMNSTADKSVAQGDAEAMVKAVDSDGKRLYPTADAGGTPVQAHVDPALTEGQVEGAVVNQLTDILALRVGRMFHKYSLDDADMTK